MQYSRNPDKIWHSGYAAATLMGHWMQCWLTIIWPLVQQANMACWEIEQTDSSDSLTDDLLLTNIQDFNDCRCASCPMPHWWYATDLCHCWGNTSRPVPEFATFPISAWPWSRRSCIGNVCAMVKTWCLMFFLSMFCGHPSHTEDTNIIDTHNNNNNNNDTIKYMIVYVYVTYM